MSNKMITHILYQLMGKFNVGSIGFRRVLACVISLLVFGLMFAVVRFTGMVIPNFTRNLVMLAGIDLAGFAFLVWKEKPEIKKEEPKVEEMQQEKEPEIQQEKQQEVEIQQEQSMEVKEDDDLEAVMNEIIEENREKIEQMEKEMSAA